MASKSRRQRRKEATKAERSKGAITQTQASPDRQEAAPTPKAAPTPSPSPVRRTMSSPAAVSTAITYPHVAGELKKIGITAVIMLAVLGILSRVI